PVGSDPDHPLGVRFQNDLRDVSGAGTAPQVVLETDRPLGRPLYPIPTSGPASAVGPGATPCPNPPNGACRGWSGLQTFRRVRRGGTGARYGRVTVSRAQFQPAPNHLEGAHRQPW